MEAELSLSPAEEVRWLFTPRLQFMDARESILSRISDHSLLQDLSDHKKKQFPPLNRPISSHSDLQRVLDVLNAIVVHCRFHESNINSTLARSRAEMKTKKQVKDTDRHLKSKIRRLMEVMHFGEQEEQHWRAVLNHKNIVDHLQNIYLIFCDLLNQNFELLEHGVVLPKNQSADKALQIKICILAIDIVCLISSIKFAFLPYTSEELTNNATSKFQQEQKKFLDDGLAAFESAKAKDYEKLSKAKISKFYEAAQRLSSELDDSQFMHFKIWSGVFDIKLRYLIDEQGLRRFKFDGKLESTCINEIALYWMQLNSKYLRSYSNLEQRFTIPFGQTFKEYQYIFGYWLDEAAKRPEQAQGVISYLFLIEAVWLDIDKEEASRIFWQQLIKAANKDVLPAGFLTQKKQAIMEAGQNIIEGFQQKHNQEYIQQMKAFVLNKSQELLDLDYLSDLVNDYFIKQYRKIKALFAERAALNRQLITLRAMLKKLMKRKKDKQVTQGLHQCNGNTEEQPQQLQISEKETIQFVEDITDKRASEGLSQCNRHSENKPQQPQISEREIIKLVKDVSDKIAKPIVCTQVDIDSHPERAVQQLFGSYPSYADLIEEVQHFMLLAGSFVEVTSISVLERCCNYYRKKRLTIMGWESQLSRDSINRMRFGIMDSISVVLFELITSIKLQKEKGTEEQSDKGIQQKLQKIAVKLLRIYQLKVKMRKREEDLEQEDEHLEEASQLLMLKRSSSYDIDPHSFYVEDLEIEAIQSDEQITDDGFTHNLMKKILQLRVEVILKKLEALEAQERPLRQEYQEIKKRVYSVNAGQQTDLQTMEDIKKYPEIEYDFLMKKYYQGWRKLRDLRNPIEDTLKILENIWGGKSNIMKLYANIYYRYKEHHRTTQNHHDAGELKQAQVEKFISECLEAENRRSKDRGNEEIRANLRRALRILQNLQMISTLKKQRDEQQQKLETLQQAKHYRSQKQELKLKQLQGKLEISSVYKNDTPIMKRYTILHVQGREFDELMVKLKKLTRLNRTITLKADRQKGTVIMEVDQQQLSFESYPKLIKYLIESYLETIEFCKNQMNFSLYPLVLHRHIKIGKRHDSHIPLKFYPYEGILLHLLLDQKEVKSSNLYRYPQYPFIEFSNQLNFLIFKCKDRIYDQHNPTSQYYAFKHLVEEMKALSMQVQEGTRETVKRILKCPYFWSSTDKLFQLVEFKERYQSNINIQESRRKENERIRSELETEEELEAFTPERKHPLYKSASGYNKTTQFYFSIEGLLEKQAFEEDIGNFKEKQQEYKYHAYWWIKNKPEIERLIEMVSERERRKGCRKATVYEKTFNSFQNQIRNLRNLAVHYIYDDQKKKEIDLEEKINIFEAHFPKLFIFLYRWRPFLGKDYVNEIKLERIKFLKEIFNRQDQRETFRKLESIEELSDYNIKNLNGYLMKLFGYDFSRVNGCEPCKILCNSLSKQESLWSFLEDVKRAKVKEGKDMTYNLLFWEHDKKGCNGMRFLEKAFFNVRQRNQFTTEEFSHVKSSLTLLQVEKQRLEKRIQRQMLREQRRAHNSNVRAAEGEEDDSSSEESTRESEARARETVERRLNKLSSEERDQLYEEMANTDYVCKYFIFQLEMKLPYLFYDLRRQRYQWDDRANEFPRLQQ